MPTSLVLSFLRAHWKGLVYALALLLAFASGRFLTPSKVVTKTETKTVVQDKVVTKTVTVQAETKAEERIVYRDRTVVTHANGDVEHRDIEKRETEDVDRKSVAESDTKATDHLVIDDRKALQVKTFSAPNWVVTAGMGVPLTFDSPTPFFILGASRRIVGPLFFGLSGMLDIHGQHPTVTGVLGVTF